MRLQQNRNVNQYHRNVIMLKQLQSKKQFLGSAWLEKVAYYGTIT